MLIASVSLSSFKRCFHSRSVISYSECAFIFGMCFHIGMCSHFLNVFQWLPHFTQAHAQNQNKHYKHMFTNQNKHFSNLLNTSHVTYWFHLHKDLIRASAKIYHPVCIWILVECISYVIFSYLFRTLVQRYEGAN